MITQILLLLTMGVGKTDEAIVISCTAPHVTLQPSDGTTDVPVDARVLVDVLGDGCPSAEFSLTLWEGVELLAERTVTVPGDYAIVRLEPFDLAPSTSYQLRLSTDDNGHTGGVRFGGDEVSFTTGTEVATGASSAPAMTIRSLDVRKSVVGGLFTARLNGNAGATQAGLGVLQLRDARFPDELAVEAVLDPSGAFGESITWTGEFTRTEVCITLSREAATGEAGPESEPLCAVPDKIGGCDHGPGRLGSLAPLFALLLARRRRR